MAQKKCKECGKKADKMIEKNDLIDKKAYFCNDNCFNEYKKKNESEGACEFC